MGIPDKFDALMVRRDDSGRPSLSVERLTPDDLPNGDVDIRVDYASFNYKDALACRAHPGVVGALPHVPGVDCAGVVVRSELSCFQPGEEVLITGYDLGSGVWGGYSEYVRVPADWIVPMPKGLDARSAMVYGTAGFTAAQSVDALRRHGVTPDRGPVIVTGATGGVGVLALAMLVRLGYEVTAVSGKSDYRDTLRSLGASQVVGREIMEVPSDRPLLRSQWAGAIDTVGGPMLAMLLRSTHHRGCVTACGLVAGHDLPLTVYPFILRGVTLAGIDSAKCPREPRLEMWRRLSDEWRVDLPESLITTLTLSEIPQRVKAILEGKVVGRTLVKPGGG